MTTIAMSSHSHHRLPASEFPDGVTALLVTTVGETGAELLTGAVLDPLGLGVGDGVGLGVGLAEVTGGAVTWKLATPTVPEVWPIASSRWVPATVSAGTVNSAWATPAPLAVTGGSATSLENSVRLTCSPGLNPENTTIWFWPATTVGEAMSSGLAVVGAVGWVGSVGSVGAVLLELVGGAKVSGTVLSSDRTESPSLAV
jgi:hypothetical protein